MHYFKMEPYKIQLELHKKMSEGDEDARCRLIESFIPLGYNIARKMEQRGIFLDELESESTLGVIKAIDNWQPEKARLTTLVYACVHRTLLSYIAKNKTAFTTPNNIFNRNTNPKLREMFTHSMHTLRYGFSVNKFGKRDDNSIENRMSKINDYNLEDRSDSAALANSLINSLPEKYKKVLEAFYGINRDKIPKAQIKSEFGFSPQRFSQLVIQATNLLKSNVESLNV